MVGRAPADGDGRIGDQALEQPGWPRRRGDHDPRVLAQAQPEHEHVPGLGVPPGGHLIAPCRIVLRSAQTGPMKLTPKQARFVQEYLIDLNAAQAAIRAGYSAKTARVIGHENLTKPDIAAAIEKAMAERAERTELTADWVIDELRKIAGANMADYVQYTPEGAPHLDFAALTRDQAAAVREMTVEDVVGGKRVSFKLYDKLGALDKLGRHLGIFREKQQSEVEVAVDVVELRETVIRVLDRLAAARAAAGDRGGTEPRTITEVPTAVELVEREAAAAAARPKAEYAPGSLEYQALHPDWTPQED